MTSGATRTRNVRALEWTNNRLRLLDQTLLPTRVHYEMLERWPQVVTAITTMQVRGAPALGVAGAYGVVLAPDRRRLAAASPWRACTMA